MTTTPRQPEALRRRPDSSVELDSKPAHPSNRLWSESLFNRLSRFSLFDGVSAIAIGELLETSFAVKNPLLAFILERPDKLRSAARHKLLKRLGGSVPTDLEDMTLSSFLTVNEISQYSIRQHSQLLSSTLRYCRECLGLGFHSMLYQHAAVAACPYHRVRLLDICIDCKRPWKPTIEKTVSTPYACPSCSFLYWKTVAPRGATEQLRAATRAVSDCWHALRVSERVRHERVVFSALDSSYRPEAHTAASVRRVQRATAWPTELTHPWLRFKETRHELLREYWPHEGELRSVSWQHIAEIPNETLKWLLCESDAHVAQSQSLVEGSWQHIQYITPLHRGRQLGVVATALHLTMAKYGWQRIDYRSVAEGWQRDHPYDGVRWNGTRSPATPLGFGPLSGRLIAAEILGYFALIVLHCAGLSPLGRPVGEPGPLAFRDADYCPAWILQRWGQTLWTVRYRKRATKKLIIWLLKRYSEKPLQRMVVCSWNSSPVFPEIARLTEPQYPLELLQFPRKAATSRQEAGTTEGWL